RKHSMTGDRILPLLVDPGLAIDIDNLEQWQLAEWILCHRELKVVRPTGPGKSPIDVRLVVFDFDGVLTDNRVYVTEEGRESVACSRSDGMGLAKLKDYGVDVAVLSTEENPVVSARCSKLGVTCIQGAKEKAPAFISLVSSRGLALDQVAYV